jgi:hypothetical protein
MQTRSLGIGTRTGAFPFAPLEHFSSFLSTLFSEEKRQALKEAVPSKTIQPKKEKRQLVHLDDATK